MELGNFRQLYKQFIPFIWSVVAIKDSELEGMLTRYSQNMKSADSSEEITKYNCFLSHVLSASMGDSRDVGFTSFVDDSIKHLFKITDSTFHSHFRKKLKEALLDMSEPNMVDVKNPAYINPLAELLLVDTFISRLPQKYKLQAMDACMGNGKDSDYLFVRQDDGCKIYMDVMSLHCIKPEKVDSVEGLYKILAKKINDKFDDKVKNLSLIHDNLYDINGESSEFHVVPILWAEVCDLLPYSEVFDQLQANGISGLMYSLKPRKLENGSYTFSMELVSNIIKDCKYELSQM